MANNKSIIIGWLAEAAKKLKKKTKHRQIQKRNEAAEEEWRETGGNSRSEHKANFEEFLIKMQGSSGIKLSFAVFFAVVVL